MGGRAAGRGRAGGPGQRERGPGGRSPARGLEPRTADARARAGDEAAGDDGVTRQAARALASGPGAGPAAGTGGAVTLVVGIGSGDGTTGGELWLKERRARRWWAAASVDWRGAPPRRAPGGRRGRF